MDQNKPKNDVMGPGGKQQADSDVLAGGKQQPGMDGMADEGAPDATAAKNKDDKH
jgi:hypothetical protein